MAGFWVISVVTNINGIFNEWISKSVCTYGTEPGSSSFTLAFYNSSLFQWMLWTQHINGMKDARNAPQSWGELQSSLCAFNDDKSVV